jgi:hypothetical protein
MRLAISGGIFLACLILCCGVLGLLGPASQNPLTQPGRGASRRGAEELSHLGIAQEQLWLMRDGSDLRDHWASVGYPATLIRDDDTLRIWQLGSSELRWAVSGPRDNINGVFVVCRPRLDRSDLLMSSNLYVYAIAATMGPNYGRSPTAGEVRENTQMVDWILELIRTRDTGSRVLRGV